MPPVTFALCKGTSVATLAAAFIPPTPGTMTTDLVATLRHTNRGGAPPRRSLSSRQEKSIRYVIPTHHHDDHSGGLRDHIAGTTVVTTSGNRAYVANELFVAWIPEAGVLYDGGYAQYGFERGRRPNANMTATVSFGDWLRRRSWNVRTFVGMHHPPVPASALEILAQSIPHR